MIQVTISEILPPQVQSTVVSGSQYAVLAKWVKGVNSLI